MTSATNTATRGEQYSNHGWPREAPEPVSWQN